jgi:hypothetical protein
MDRSEIARSAANQKRNVMNMHHLAGIVIIVGFVIYWIGNLYSPPRVYQESDLATRLQIVADYPGRFAVSQALGGVGIAVVFAGLLLVSLQAQGGHSPWLTYLPAALNIVATVLITLWLYQYITDPAAIWGGTAGSPLLLAASILMMVAGILYGILFLQIGLPAWFGYLTSGYAAVALGAIVIARPPAFAVISLYFFVLLAVAIALIRQ